MKTLLKPIRSTIDTQFWNVEDYQRFIDHGILTDEDKVELLDGQVVNKMPANPPHDWSMAILMRLIQRILTDDYLLRSQSGIQLNKTNRPEPDLAVIRWTAKSLIREHPGPSDVALVIEVSDSSLDRDRTSKGDIYAKSGIPEYWIVNVQERLIEVYSEPSVVGYGKRNDYGRDQRIPVELDGKLIGTASVAEIFPEAKR